MLFVLACVVFNYYLQLFNDLKHCSVTNVQHNKQWEKKVTGVVVVLSFSTLYFTM